MSRIATGLVTGSFVGLLTAIANYVYARGAFFEKLSYGLLKISSRLGLDYNSAKLRCFLLFSFEEGTKVYTQTASFEKEVDQVVNMKSNYNVLLGEIGFGDFAGILPMDRKVSEALNNLNEHLNHNVGHLYEELDSCLKFSWFSPDVSEDTRGRFLSDPDRAYDLLIRRNKEFPDILAYDIDQLAKICFSFETASKWALPSSVKDAFRQIQKDAESLLDGVDVRDVRKERWEDAVRKDCMRKEKGIPWSLIS